jgi:hypothetical protein
MNPKLYAAAAMASLTGKGGMRPSFTQEQKEARRKKNKQAAKSRRLNRK